MSSLIQNRYAPKYKKNKRTLFKDTRKCHLKVHVRSQEMEQEKFSKSLNMLLILMP
jgi:hypothetical protein